MCVLVNNIDGNNLVIFFSIVLYYGDTYVRAINQTLEIEWKMFDISNQGFIKKPYSCYDGL